jgi:hypothetical protein
MCYSAITLLALNFEHNVKIVVKTQINGGDKFVMFPMVI